MNASGYIMRQEPDGLQTALKGSQHAELIEFAGGENVLTLRSHQGQLHTGLNGTGNDMEP